MRAGMGGVNGSTPTATDRPKDGSDGPTEPEPYLRPPSLSQNGWSR